MTWLLLRIGPPLRAVRGVLGNRAIVRAQVAFLLFNVVEAAAWVGILVFAYSRGGIEATGIVGALLLIPAGVAAPAVAATGDRFRRDRFVSWGSAIQAVAVAATGGAMLLPIEPVWAYGLAALSMVALTTGRPGHHSLLPELARTPDELAAGNSVSALIEGIGGSAGTLAATLVLGLADVGVLYLVLAGVASAAALVAVREGVAPERVPGGGAPWALVAHAVRGVGQLVRAPGARLLLGLAAAMTLSWGVYDVLLVTAAFEQLGIGESGVGALHTVIGVGVLAGAVGSLSLVGRARLARALLAGAVVMGVAVAAQGIDRVWVVVAGAAGTGLAVTLLDVSGRTLLQRVVEDDVLTRVFGVIESLWSIGFGIGALVAAPLERWLGLGGAFVACGAVLPALTLASFPALRRLDRRAVVPELQLTLLRDLSIFAPLPRSDLERTARQLERLEVHAGDEVVREGEVGDRFYVIERGSFVVEVRGREVRPLSPGDHFGEIALLHDVPRTASVRATTDGVVWALDQEAFLATVTGMPQAESEAHRISAERLRASRPG